MKSLYRQSERRGKLWAATALVVFLILVDIVSGGKVRGVARASAAALSRAFSGAVASISGNGFFSSRASLAAQNRALSDELANYQERAAYADVLQAENDQLRSLVHLAQTSQGITAPVVSSVISSPYGTFLIGAGQSDNVARGSLVLTGGGFVVGKVTDAGAHVSTVQEVFAPSASLNVIVHGAAAQLSGSGGGNAHLSLPRGAQIAVGDAVTSPELGGRAVGIVGSIASSSAQASQDIFIDLPVSLDALQFVYVVSP